MIWPKTFDENRVSNDYAPYRIIRIVITFEPIITRPSVAGAVLQTLFHWLMDSVSHGLCKYIQNSAYPKWLELGS